MKFASLHFLAATGFREKVIRQNSVDQGAPAPKRRGMFGGRGEKSVADREFLESFFYRLEKAPSHYCRQSTSKIYLEPLIKTRLTLYNYYATAAKDAGLEPYSRTWFDRYFEENNYSLVKPKKDMCDTCLAHRTGNITNEEWTAHMEF